MKMCEHTLEDWGRFLQHFYPSNLHLSVTTNKRSCCSASLLL